MSLSMRRLSPAAGTEVIGLDLTQPVGANLFRELYDAWLNASGVLVLGDQDITPDQHIAFSRNLGELQVGNPNSMLGRYYLPGHAEIYRVSNKKIDGQPIGREDAGTDWHSDGSRMTEPSKASLLHALEIPPVGGDTMFADMYRAYDKLSERTNSPVQRRCTRSCVPTPTVAARLCSSTAALRRVSRLALVTPRNAVWPCDASRFRNPALSLPPKWSLTLNQPQAARRTG
jgi:alpha-ketoglutarate-dependent taurine dioxygenase